MSWIWPNNQGVEPCQYWSLSLLSVWHNGILLVEAPPCSTCGSDQCHSQHCGRPWWQGNSSNASSSLRWGPTGSCIWTLGISKTLCGVVWHQRMHWWCKAHDISKAPAAADLCHCIHPLQSDWDSWVRPPCHHTHVHWTCPAQRGPSTTEITWWCHPANHKSHSQCHQGPWGLRHTHSADQLVHPQYQAARRVGAPWLSLQIGPCWAVHLWPQNQCHAHTHPPSSLLARWRCSQTPPIYI